MPNHEKNGNIKEDSEKREKCYKKIDQKLFNDSQNQKTTAVFYTLSGSFLDNNS